MKKEASTDGTLALLHEFARDVVNRRDMIGVDRVAQAERVSQQSRAKQNWPPAQDRERPEPDENVAGDQGAVDGQQTAAQVGAAFSQDF